MKPDLKNQKRKTAEKNWDTTSNKWNGNLSIMVTNNKIQRQSLDAHIISRMQKFVKAGSEKFIVNLTTHVKVFHLHGHKRSKSAYKTATNPNPNPNPSSEIPNNFIF